MSKMGLTKAQLKLVKEFKDTDDYKQLQYKYIAIRSSGKRASIKDKLIELAKKFVDKYKDQLPKLAYELLVKKFARRFQDYMEDVAKPILAQAKKKEPEKNEEKTYSLLLEADTADCRTLVETATSRIAGFAKLHKRAIDLGALSTKEDLKHIIVLENKDSVTELFVKYVNEITAGDEKSQINDVAAKAFAKITPDNLLFVLVNSIISMAETLEDLSDDFKEFKDTFRSAMIVKEGDLIDRKTKKPKHVGWSWLHSIQSELAQLRGISADKKEDEYINTPSTPQPPQYVPVPYQLPYPPPPWTTPPDKPWWQQPEGPSYPTITCKNSATASSNNQ